MTSGKWVGPLLFWMFKVSVFWFCFALSKGTYWKPPCDSWTTVAPIYLPQKETSALNTWPEAPPFPSLCFRKNSILVGERNLLGSLSPCLVVLFFPSTMKYSSHDWIFVSTSTGGKPTNIHDTPPTAHDLKPTDMLLCTFIRSHDFQVVPLNEISSSQFCSKWYYGAHVTLASSSPLIASDMAMIKWQNPNRCHRLNTHDTRGLFLKSLMDVVLPRKYSNIFKIYILKKKVPWPICNISHCWVLQKLKGEEKWQ